MIVSVLLSILFCFFLPRAVTEARILRFAQRFFVQIRVLRAAVATAAR
jgi:hypothetical protein